MAVLDDDEGRNEDKPPESEEEYADAVTRHAKYLGIDPEVDAAYMWIAEEVGAYRELQLWQLLRSYALSTTSFYLPQLGYSSGRELQF